nr:DUF3438 family protein [uncultured Desulfobacter sp.]
MCINSQFLFKRPGFLPVYIPAAFLVLIMIFCSVLPVQANKYLPGQINTIKLNELEFKDATVQDAVRVISELTGVNIVATGQAGGRRVTLFVRDLSIMDVVDSLCRIAGLWYRYNQKTGIFIVMTTQEYQRDIVVFRQEPTRMFQLKYLNVGIAARTISDLFGDRVELSGKADAYYGDDFSVTDASEDEAIDEIFNEEVDDGKNTGTSSSSRSQKSKSKESASSTTGNLSSRQLDLLEQNGEQEVQSVSEANMGKVSKRTESPIYVTVNRMHNMLFVRTADENAMKEIAQIIRQSDKQVPEVLLEMKVLEVELTDEFESAFQISGTSGNATYSLGSVDDSTTAPLSFELLSSDLELKLKALQENNNIKSLATPMLLAANNHPAKLFIGEETVITTGFSAEQVDNGSSDGTTVTTYVPVPETETREIGNTLTIMPSINADRSVVMRIVHENSSVNEDGGKIPLLVGDEIENVYIDTVDTAELSGTVLAQDGKTVAIGGMIRTETSNYDSKVPILGDIPVLGFFFKSQTKVKSKTELVLLITPHVLAAPGDGESISRQRLKALSDHPTGIDSYLDDLDQSRAIQTPGGTAQRTMPSEGLQDSFVKLTRTAVIQVRMPLTMRRPQGQIHPVVMGFTGRVSIFDTPGITARPMGAWTDGTHYVTALKISNETDQSATVDPNLVSGSWRAATVEDQVLAPAGKPGDFTYMYLISETDFKTNFFGDIRIGK